MNVVRLVAMIVVIVAMVFLASCSADGPPGNVQLAPGDNAPGKVYKFTVEGKTCIAVTGSSGVALDCF